MGGKEGISLEDTSGKKYVVGKEGKINRIMKNLGW